MEPDWKKLAALLAEALARMDRGRILSRDRHPSSRQGTVGRNQQERAAPRGSTYRTEGLRGERETTKLRVLEVIQMTSDADTSDPVMRERWLERIEDKWVETILSEEALSAEVERLRAVISEVAIKAHDFDQAGPADDNRFAEMKDALDDALAEDE